MSTADERRPGDRLTHEFRRIERFLIFWTSALILLAGILGFIAGRLARP
jgi:hypothetical protein